MNAFKRFIGAGFGSGFSPIAPGTLGSLVALIPVYFLLCWHPIWGPASIVMVASVLTYWVTPACEQAWGDDPSALVMDEFAGQALVFIGLKAGFSFTEDYLLLLLGFGLFRVFDILKPLGINQLQKFPGARGILLDDLLAGFYALICLKTLIFLFPDFF